MPQSRRPERQPTSQRDPTEPPGREGFEGGIADLDDGNVEEAVEQLLEEVGGDPQTQPRPLLQLDGLRGSSAIVTGGSSGIGRAIALAFARAGINVAINYLPGEHPDIESDARQVATSAREHEVHVLCRPCDVRDSAQVDSFVAEAVQKFGSLEILVNNAGIGRDRAIWRMSDDDWQAVIQTNLTGAFYFTRAVAPHFRKQEYGKIVNMTSVHGFSSNFGISNYSASKAGIVGLTRAAAADLGPHNVNVNAVAPGYIRTTRLTDGVAPEILDRARERSVLGRLGDPQDVAGVVLFLCSEAARHITGAVLPIDGGYLV